MSNLLLLEVHTEAALEVRKAKAIVMRAEIITLKKLGFPSYNELLIVPSSHLVFSAIVPCPIVRSET